MVEKLVMNESIHRHLNCVVLDRLLVNFAPLEIDQLPLDIYRAKLENAEVLCCCEELHSCLGSWLGALDSYRNKLLVTTLTMDDHDPSEGKIIEGRRPSIVAPPTPFSPLTPTVMSSATHLATLCAEVAVYSVSDSQSRGESEATGPQSGRNLERLIADYAELLDWSRVRCLLAQQQWSLREKGWWSLIKGGEC